MTVELFPHECKAEGCKRIVEYDDEPCCYEHSPDSGSNVPGYSARAEAEKQGPVRHNVFEGGQK